MDSDHFYVDLVFYNRLLRCFVLIDLKLGKLTHQDLGQMMMYVNYYDLTQRMPDETKTVGIVLAQQEWRVACAGQSSPHLLNGAERCWD